MNDREARARETLEWIGAWREGAFEPAYYDRKWPVEMYGLAKSAERHANDVLLLLEALKSRGVSEAAPIIGKAT